MDPDYDEDGIILPFDGVCPTCGTDMELADNRVDWWVCPACGAAVGDLERQMEYDVPVQLEIEDDVENDL